jgi:hypothetical protein
LGPGLKQVGWLAEDYSAGELVVQPDEQLVDAFHWTAFGFLEVPFPPSLRVPVLRNMLVVFLAVVGTVLRRHMDASDAVVVRT